MKITGTPLEVVSKLTEGKYKITSARSNLNTITVEFENIPDTQTIVKETPVKFARRSKKKSKDEEQE